MSDHKAGEVKCRHKYLLGFCHKCGDPYPAPPPSEETKCPKCGSMNVRSADPEPGYTTDMRCDECGGEFGGNLLPAPVSPKVTPERVEGPQMPYRFQSWVEPAWRDGYATALATKDAELERLRAQVAAMGEVVEAAKEAVKWRGDGVLDVLEQALAALEPNQPKEKP